MFRRRMILGAVGLLLFCCLSLAAGFALFLKMPASPAGVERVFVVPSGATLKDVALGLEKEGMVRSGRLFHLWARLSGAQRRIKSGEYLLHPGLSPVQVLDRLTRGSILTHAVTVPEGYTARQISRLLGQKGITDSRAFLALALDPETPRKYGFSAPSMEGFLYPDTYQLGRGLSASAVMNAMVGRFREVMGPFRDAVAASGMSLEQVVTLASIVEKETGKKEERPIIASVFLNRLRRGMRLESDPTVIYGLEHFNGNLTRKDLARPGPYNTYRIRGLPPGPIANPGRQAIRAVLFPAKTPYLYFVSRNDGTHHFSETLKEHNRAVRKYQKQGAFTRKKAS
ncbi:MAG: endolytic transglycosylase MltG [Deltaproteobacteria bacterium]|nr:endolytic transglycosylase MltG [Deltaproteobacteria bacterium]MBW2102292.1 endolytic transglycosylase MltG [Deltaproteobacteria bacterium]MBW2347784.1 endolytic transglycosylase MltG [Deltaproteobacteria bacterium]